MDDVLEEQLPATESTDAAPKKPKPAKKVPDVHASDQDTLLPDSVDEAPIAHEEKAPTAFKTISEVSETLDIPQHVLRFWESRFPQIKPLKLRGGRRYYRPQDIEVVLKIKQLLYKEGYTIKGAKKAFHHVAQEAQLQEPLQLPVEALIPEPMSAGPKRAKHSSAEDRKFSQLAVIRQELIGLRDVLKPYIY